MDVTVKLTNHARLKMEKRFNPPLRSEDVVEAIRKGRAYPFRGGYYLEHRNIGVILKSRMMAPCNFYVVTVIDLTQNKTPRMPLQERDGSMLSLIQIQIQNSQRLKRFCCP